MTKSVYRIAAVTGLALVLIIATLVPTALAGNDRHRTVHVTGTQMPITGTQNFTMKGDLVGTWFTRSGVATTTKPTLLVVVGTEEFVGCLDRRGDGRCGSRDLTGTLTFDFIYWANFDDKGKLIKGQCTHPVTGGTGDFAGSRGIINMYDTPVGSKVKTTYRGDIDLNAVPSEKSAADAATAGDVAATSESPTATTTEMAHACGGE